MSENLKKALANKQISMTAYSQFLGVSRKTLQNKMNGITDFSREEVEKTCTYLFPEYKVWYLFGTIEK